MARERRIDDLEDALLRHLLCLVPVQQLLGPLQCVNRRLGRLAIAALPDKLDFRGRQMRGQNLRGLLNVLQRGSKECYVECLDLRDNGLEDEDGIELAKHISLGILPNLRVLDLTANHLEYLGARAVVSAAAKAYSARGGLKILLRLNNISALSLDRVAREPWEHYYPQLTSTLEHPEDESHLTLRMDFGISRHPSPPRDVRNSIRDFDVDVFPQDRVLSVRISRANPLLLRSLLSGGYSGRVEPERLLSAESFFELNFEFRTRPTSKLVRLFEVVWWKYQERSWHAGIAEPTGAQTRGNVGVLGQQADYEFLMDAHHTGRGSPEARTYIQWEEQLSFYRLDTPDGQPRGPLQGELRLYEEGIMDDAHLVWIEDAIPRPLLLTM